MTPMDMWWWPTAIALIFLSLGYYAHALIVRAQASAAVKNAANILREARRDAEVIIKDAQLLARDEVIKAREAYEEEGRQRRKEFSVIEERLAQREATLDRKLAALDHKEHVVEEKEAELERHKEEWTRRQEDLTALVNEQRARLETIAHLPREEARKILMQQVESELKDETSALIRKMHEDAVAGAEREAREIIIAAIERYAGEQVSDVTTSMVTLPSDEMKGRIIGREGRNIRSLEAATGVNLLIDDTPEVVVISSFDPLRREIARLTLERLLADGRIQPSRIEEVVAKVKEDLEEVTRKAGEDAVFELGLHRVPLEIIKVLGRLKYRHSFSQNVLQHSIEMATLMGLMAAELGLDPEIAKRVGLFHDIGKAMDHEVQGSHAVIGAELLKRCGEPSYIYEAVAAHHGDVHSDSLYARLATAADAITAARPGARTESTSLYLKRVEKLEEIARGFPGVDKCYAMQAGRELRVFVEPAKVDDQAALQMARNLCKQIEDQVDFPGQIKVTVVRETRCIEYAR